MTSAKEALAHSLANSKMMLKRFTDDLKPDEYLHRPSPKANCVAWLIGHLALADRSTAQALGAKDLPELPAGFDKKFSRDQGCPEATEFGDVSILWPVFEKHRDLLIATVMRATQEQLDQPTKKVLPMFKNAGEFANFMSLHTAMHAGQITMIRRSLGRPPIV